jgi:hypothetical protein
MKKLLLIATIFLFISSSAFAEKWVCEKATKTVRTQGDGFKLGICGKNNTNINPKCILATDEEYNLSGQFKKIDKSIVSGPRVIDMTQAEIDAIVAAQAAASAAQAAARLQAKDDSLVEDRSALVLTKADNAIDNIGSLADAKVFLKRLVRYIVDTNTYSP